MASPVVATILLVAVCFAEVAFILHELPTCLVVCDSHACDASTLQPDGAQATGCVVYSLIDILTGDVLMTTEP